MRVIVFLLKISLSFSHPLIKEGPMNSTIYTEIINGIKFSFINREEFNAIYKSIFLKKKFSGFKVTSKMPYIIDGGAHIGISVLYFKLLFPKAEILAFEPNPISFRLLKRNIKQNKLKNIKLINAALSDKKGEEIFFMNKNKPILSWGDAIVKNAWHERGRFKIIKVPAVKLSTYISAKNIDLVKLNIEGAEGKVLKEAENKLSKVKEIIMEFHGSSVNKSNKLEEILNILKKNSFLYKIKQKGKEIKINQVKKGNPFWAIIHAFKINNG